MPHFLVKTNLHLLNRRHNSDVDLRLLRVGVLEYILAKFSRCWTDFWNTILSILCSDPVNGLRLSDFYLLLGCARFQGRCWAAIRLCHHPEPSGQGGRCKWW